MVELPPSVIQVSPDQYDTLYPRYEEAKKIEATLTFQEWLLREVQKISRKGCFSRKRSERDRALSDINRITEKFK